MFLVAACETLRHEVKFFPCMKTGFVWLTDEYLLSIVMGLLSDKYLLLLLVFLW